MSGDSSQPIPVPQTVPGAGLLPRHFDFVDALRGYAILAVILFHVNQLVLGSYSWLQYLASFGGSGVQIFFVVSAFTLFWSLRNRQAVDRHPKSAFFVRRFFRVAPLFWFGMLFYLGHPDFWRDQFAPAGVGYPQILTTAFFIHGWYPTTINSVVPGGWSIAAEMMFYLTLPLLFRWVRTFNVAIALAVITSVLDAFGRPVAVRLLAGHFPAGWIELIRLFVGFSFPAQFPCFCWGIVLYFVLISSPKTRLQQVAILAVCVTLLSFGLTGIFLASATALAAWMLVNWRISLITNRLVRYVGLISYSAYIWHFCILDWLAVLLLPVIRVKSISPTAIGTLKLAALYAAVVLVTVIIASVSYLVIERPGIRLGGWLIRRLAWGAAKPMR